MLPLLVLLSLPVLLAALFLKLHRVRRRRIRRAWRELAPRLELSLAEGGRLSGRYRGLAVEAVPTGSASQLRMALQGELPAGLHLSRQHAGTRRLRGVRDIQVGDAPLDDAVLVQAAHPAATIRLLREPAVRDALLELLAAHPQAVVTGNEVVVPLEKDPEEEHVRAVLRAQERLAAALGDAARRFQEHAREAREQARREPLPPAHQPPLANAGASQSSEPSLRELQDDFAQRRLLHWLLTWPAVGTGWGLGLIGGAVRKGRIDLDISGPTWEQAGMFLFITGILATAISGYFLMRCPACGGSLARNSRHRPYETQVCPHCQLRLSP